MELTSFPQSGEDVPKRQIFTGIYGKVYSAASQVLNSLLSEDQDAAAASTRPPLKSGPSSSQSLAGAVSTSTHEPIGRSFASNLPLLTLATPSVAASAATMALSTEPSQTPSVISSSTESERTDANTQFNPSTVHFDPPRSGSLALSPVAKSNSRPQSVPTPRLSASTTVSLSDTRAVPTLPGDFVGNLTPVHSYRLSPSANFRSSSIGPDDTASDVESLFSVNSTSTSRDYLAAHYARSSSRRGSRTNRLSKDFWMKDENATTCFGCNRQFTTFRRRHHCRICGQIFCGACTSLISGESFGHSDRRVRCCKACQEATANHSSSEDEDVSQSFVGSPRPETISSRLNPGSQERWPDFSGNDHDEDERRLVEDEPEIPTISGPLTFARSFLGTHSRRSSMGYPHNLADEIGRRSRANSLHSDNGTGSATSAPQLPQLLQPHYPHQLHQNGDPFNPKSDQDNQEEFESYTPNHSHLHLTLTGLESPTSQRDFTPPPPHLQNAMLNTVQGQERAYPTSVARFPLPNTVTVDLNNACKSYAQLFLDRVLVDCDIAEHWKSKLMDPLLTVTASVHLENNERVAPRDWVKIKRIPGNAGIIETMSGLVLTHTLARRSMPTHLDQPKLLLISFPVEYSRGPDKYMSLSPVIAQETEYLRKLVDRIISLHPTKVISCTRICGQAIDMLDKAGIGVATHLREQALLDLARISKADILPSIDRLSANPRLGTCMSFDLNTYRYESVAKTFFFFSNRSIDPGRTALIIGPPNETVMVKMIMEIMVDVCYSLKMETALMRDQLVLTPHLEPMKSEDVLSSSPFVNYGQPFLQYKASQLEDAVVELGHSLDTFSFSSTVGAEEKEGQVVTPEIDYKALDLNPDIQKFPAASQIPTARFIQQTRHSQVYQKWTEAKYQWDLIKLNDPYLFNPSSHQNLLLLFSVHCSDNSAPCVGPEQMLIEFYLDTDQTLGQFVENTCMQYDDACPDGCARTLGDHQRIFVHGRGRISVVVERMPSRIPGLQDSILMWSKCKVCQREMPVAPMSSTTWKYSFGKYLELSFWGEPLRMRADSCSHNIYRDHIRYFGWHDLAIKVEYQDIDLYEIRSPPLQLMWDPQQLAFHKFEVYQEMQSQFGRYWDSIKDALSKVRIENLEDEKIKELKSHLASLQNQAALDHEECLKNLENAYIASGPGDYLSLNETLVSLQQYVDKWNNEFTEFDNQFFPTERDIRRVTAQHLRGLFGEESFGGTENSDEATINSEKTGVDAQPIESIKDAIGEGQNSNNQDSQSSFKAPEPDQENNVKVDQKDQKDLHSVQASSPDPNTVEPSSPTYKASDSKLSQSHLVPDKDQPRPKTRRSGSGRVSFLARQFEELSQEFERERQKEHQRLKERQRSMAVRQAQPVAEVFNDVEEAMKGDWNHPRNSAVLEEERSNHVRSNSQAISTQSTETETGTRNEHAKEDAKEDAQPDPDGQKEDSPTCHHIPEGRTVRDEVSSLLNDVEVSKEAKDIERREPARMSLIRTLASFWAERSTVPWNNIKYVLSSTDHFFTNSLVVIRESEPSSIIAFCLSLPDYRHRLSEIYGQRQASLAVSRRSSMTGVGGLTVEKTNIGLNPLSSGQPIPPVPPVPNSANSVNEDDGGPSPGIPASSGVSPSNTPTPSVYGDVDDSRLEQAMLKQTGTHMRYHFGQGSTTVSCKVFFSEQFDALRRKCGCSDGYIQSLSRCSTWDNAGGKSGSSFLKTSDDRLIVKELSQAEFDSFAGFAPSYFEYMAQALFHDLPTALAKFYGFYQITIRNQQQQSSQTKMYVLVMENLFYGRRFSRFFDLKGSMRNRKVAETGRENEVLLDENMVEFIFEKPLFVHEHSKKLLRASLYNDTLFLTKMNVMDYSLVIGMDDDRKTIVAGIIDFVRTYTWDKKIESWVKGKASTGIKEPTVVGPKQYKNRFRESMEQYFLMVPDCWNQVTPGQ